MPKVRPDSDHCIEKYRNPQTRSRRCRRSGARDSVQSLPVNSRIAAWSPSVSRTKTPHAAPMSARKAKQPGHPAGVLAFARRLAAPCGHAHERCGPLGLSPVCVA